MARRYCGDCAVYINLSDANTQVYCTISCQGQNIHNEYISYSNVINRGLAIDSPEAFDDYAGAAIAFMDNHFDDLSLNYDMDTPDYNLDIISEGYYIRRNKKYSSNDINKMSKDFSKVLKMSN